MPAVRVFSLYAAVAVFVDFLLQITCFVALLSLDAKRQASDRPDIFCCIKMKKNPFRSGMSSDREGLLYKFVKNYYSKALLSQFVRPLVVSAQAYQL